MSDFAIIRFKRAYEHVQEDCLNHQKAGKKCIDCFYYNDKGPECARDCIWYRIGMGKPDTWDIPSFDYTEEDDNDRT